MDNEAAKAIFNQVIAQQADADKIAKLEIVREFFTNPDFRKYLEDTAWQINSRAA